MPRDKSAASVTERWRPYEPGDPVLDALVEADGPSELAHNHVPTCDQNAPVATYVDWKTEDTRVVSCRIANDLYPKDPRYETRDEARAATQQLHGRILEANWVPGRGFLRVFKRRRP